MRWTVRSAARPRRWFLLGAVLLALAAPSAQAAAGGWRWPLPGVPVLVRGFDPPPAPWAPGHRGVDLRGRAGEAVLAAGPGTVGFAGLLAGRGVVTVHHGSGLETTYEPVAPEVRAGQRVDVGAVLGRLQPGHGSCGAGYVCLHWGLRRGEVYLDPLSLVEQQHIRLLPIWRAGLPVARAPAASTVRPPRGQPSVARSRGTARTVTSVAAATIATASVFAIAPWLLRRRRARS
jgi:murein DD-endopeptidase MepM/ murein hydrolase activator NlpD